MKHFIAAVEDVVVIMFVVFLLSLHAWSSCGTELWSKKVLDDGFSLSGTPVKSTVADLVNIKPPSQLQIRHATSRFPVEKLQYKVHAVVLGYKLEADQDYHIVVEDLKLKQTLIVEIPDPSCSKTHSEDFAQARREFAEIFPDAPKAKYRLLDKPVPVMLIGVGLFDIKHGVPQIGVAKNGLELHPLLHIKP